MHKYCMPYYEVVNLVIVTMKNMIENMPLVYWILSTTSLKIRDQIFLRADFYDYLRPGQVSQTLQHWTMLTVNSCSVLNAHLSLQVLSEAPETALAESEITLRNSKGAWEDLKVLKSSCVRYRSVWQNCVWLPDWHTFCWSNIIDTQR
jgi:hypothetical protein